MKIALGADHAGFNYKEAVKRFLLDAGHEVLDRGAFALDPEDDYPDWIRPAAEAVANGEADRCIVFGGSGNGEAIVANKSRGVRCALCWDEQTALWGRQHNDANGLSLGERTVTIEQALHIVRLWLDTPFEGGRHARRIGKIIG